MIPVDLTFASSAASATVPVVAATPVNAALILASLETANAPSGAIPVSYTHLTLPTSYPV